MPTSIPRGATASHRDGQIRFQFSVQGRIAGRVVTNDSIWTRSAGGAILAFCRHWGVPRTAVVGVTNLTAKSCTAQN